MTTNKCYPYPVLGNGDDLEGEFDYFLYYTLEPERVVFDNEFVMEHETLEKLIHEEQAAFLIEVEGGSTFYRNAFRSHEKSFSLSVPASDLRGQVSVSSFVCAIKPISSYAPINAHPDLQGDPASVDAGEILAIGPVRTFVAEKEFDPMNAPVSSFLKIQQGAAAHGPMNVRYDPDKVVVELSKQDHDYYVSIPKKSIAGIVHASIVLPVLADTLNLMESNPSEYQECIWFGRLQQICDQRRVNTDEPLKAAQEILRLPLSRNFRNVRDLMELENV